MTEMSNKGILHVFLGDRSLFWAEVFEMQCTMLKQWRLCAFRTPRKTHNAHEPHAHRRTDALKVSILTDSTGTTIATDATTTTGVTEWPQIRPSKSLTTFE